MLIHKTIVEQHRDKKGDVLFRSIGVLPFISEKGIPRHAEIFSAFLFIHNF